VSLEVLHLHSDAQPRTAPQWAERSRSGLFHAAGRRWSRQGPPPGPGLQTWR
jgi:hypothetical protein